MSNHRTPQVIPHCHGTLAVCVGLAAASAANTAWGADPRDLRFADQAWASLQQEASGPSSAYELNSIVLPRLGDTTQHIGVTRWIAPESLNAWGSFGLSLGVSAPAPSAAAAPLAAGAVAPAGLDLGVRWRSRLDSGRHLDITAWAHAPSWSPPQDAMGMIWQSQQPMYGTRVEVQWASSRTHGLVPEFGAVGVQLQGGSRLVLRARKGGPMLYYRAKF